MSEGPVKFMELCYEFDSSAALDEIANVCASIRNLPGVADVELCNGIAVPGGKTPICRYKLIVGLENNAAIGIVQEYLGQYKQEVRNLKIGLYIGTYQKLD